jgi:hypothetical protein
MSENDDIHVCIMERQVIERLRKTQEITVADFLHLPKDPEYRVQIISEITTNSLVILRLRFVP